MLCYACRGTYTFKSVEESQRRNLAMSKTKNFVPAMVAFIHRVGAVLVRIHAAGDFYSVAYVRRWERIIRECPDTQFFAYTRSWRVTSECSPELVAAVKRLSRLPNLRLWLSCDADTGRPPRWGRSPWAYLSTKDSDVPAYPVELIFRDKPSTPARRMGPHGALVCPYEQAIEREAKITCEKCRICFDSRRQVLKRFEAEPRGRRRRRAVANP